MGHDATETANRLDEATAEAWNLLGQVRAAIKDLRAAARDARTAARTAADRAIEEHVVDAVEEGLKRFTGSLTETLDFAAKHTNEQFDKIGKPLMASLGDLHAAAQAYKDWSKTADAAIAAQRREIAELERRLAAMEKATAGR